MTDQELRFQQLVDAKVSEIRCLEEELLQCKDERLSAEELARELQAAVAARDEALVLETTRSCQWQEAAKMAVAEVEAKSCQLRSTKGVLRSVRESLRCPINHRLCIDPVIATDGYTYDRKGISPWISAHGTSPMTREQLLRRLVPNKQSKTVLQHLAEEGLGASDSEEEAEAKGPLGTNLEVF